MRKVPMPGERPLLWVGPCKKDLLRFPDAVIDAIGTALSVAQFGGFHPSAKLWQGEGPGVVEIVEDFNRATYRAAKLIEHGRFDLKRRFMSSIVFKKSHQLESRPPNRMSI